MNYTVKRQKFMKVTQISIGRFHHFHLARQLEKANLLDAIYTGYPKFQLKEEGGIPKNRIKTFPWIHAPYMKRSMFGFNKSKWLNREWEWLDKQLLDKFVSQHITYPTILVGLSGSGLNAGKKAQLLGGKYICDRGSSHIRFQNEILNEEFKIWGYKFKGVDPRVIDKEENEYQISDQITVPSEFVKRSFLLKGVPEQKITKVIYGARLDRFKKTQNPPSNTFRLLWVGAVSIRKGFMYALEAFQRFKYSSKEFVVVGSVDPEIKEMLRRENITNIKFLGNVPNAELPMIYSTAHAFVLASLEEGLAMVQGEALACGCPVIASANTGAEDLFSNGIEGFIVPIRSAQAILERIENLADDSTLQKRMSDAAIKRVTEMGGWDSYGSEYKNLLIRLQDQKFSI